MGANEAVMRMLDRIGTVENIPAFLEGVKSREEKLFGFGHRVYKNFDPRAKIIRRVADEIFEITGKDPLIQVATELERAAPTDEYFVKRKLYPNVDFYSGLVYRAMGFPPDFFTCLFTIPRRTLRGTMLRRSSLPMRTSGGSPAPGRGRMMRHDMT